MEQGQFGELKAPSRTARVEADILNRMQLLKDGPNSQRFALSHGYVLSRSRILAMLLTAFLQSSFVFALLFFFSYFESKSHITYYHFFTLNISRDTIRSTLLITTVGTVDYVLLLRGVSGNKRWILTCIMVAPLWITLLLLFHWSVMGN